MYERILLATDGSDGATAAGAHAVSLARRYGAELHAVYVVETRTGYDNAIVDPEVVRRNLREEGEAALAAVETRAGSDSVVTSIREGVPHEELLAYVDEMDIDLVVVGSKGRSAFRTILLGSTTEAVLRADAVPVLVVNDDTGGSTRP
ncbi:universal stress protein [Halalkalicoccus sp. NIPERK01]|uniref:universal stress protein n=1 Tax=Halalkalicoccus sp. NIPERK01 TaxID=3053469 RepID=UPI00256F241A|nr:universal stress protein [Halalkalicoccus sp. NIPERK01]MDL5361721.1 universal stress protein [Halalkalicoccus sp. NIPERK01]